MTEDEETRYPSSKIEDLDDMDLGPKSVALDYMTEIETIYEALIDELEDIDGREPELESAYVLTQRERTLVFEFFTITFAVIESHSSNSLFEFIIPESEKVRRGGEQEPGREFFNRNLNQRQREELLFRCGLIDEGLKGELNKIRGIRNDLVHDVFERRLLDVESDILADANRAKKAAEKNGYGQTRSVVREYRESLKQNISITP